MDQQVAYNMLLDSYRPGLLKITASLLLWIHSFAFTFLSVHQLPLDIEGKMLHMGLILLLLLAIYLLTHTQNNYNKGCLKKKFGWNGDEEMIQAYKGSKTNFIMAWLFVILSFGVFGTLMMVSKLSPCNRNAFGTTAFLLVSESYHLISIVRQRIDSNDATYARFLKKKA